MPAVDPVSRCIACIFNIEPDLFNYDTGNLSPPGSPGIGGMVNTAFETITDLLTYSLDPLKYIQDGDIPGLVSWLAPYSGGLPAAMYDLFMNRIWGPFEKSLKVNLPPFELEIKELGLTIPLPGIDTGNPSPPGWIEQIPTFIKFLIGILLFPFYVIYKIILSLLEFSFPAINLKFFELIWQAIVPTFGFPVETKPTLLRFGNCFMKILMGILPDGVPSDEVNPNNPIPVSFKLIYPNEELNGSQLSSIASGGYDSEIALEDRSHINFKIRTNTSRLAYIIIKYAGSIVYFPNKAIELRGDNPSSFTCTPVYPVSSFPIQITGIPANNTIILKLSCNSPAEGNPENATLVLFDDDDNVVRFFLESKTKNVLNILQEAYNNFGGEWDSEVNLFGIRYENKRTNSWEDIIGVAYLDTDGRWKLKAARGTTRPGSPRNLEPNGTEESSREADYYYHNFFHKNIYARGTHGSIGKFYNDPVLVAIDSSSEGMSWRDPIGKKNGIYDPSKRLKGWNHYATMNFHTTARYSAPNLPINTSAPTIIGNHSWGCQVIQYYKNFVEMMNILLKYDSGGRKYSYMLFLRENVQELWDSINPILPPLGSSSSTASTVSPIINID